MLLLFHICVTVLIFLPNLGSPMLLKFPDLSVDVLLVLICGASAIPVCNINVASTDIGTYSSTTAPFSVVRIDKGVWLFSEIKMPGTRSAGASHSGQVIQSPGFHGRYDILKVQKVGKRGGFLNRKAVLLTGRVIRPLALTGFIQALDKHIVLFLVHGDLKNLFEWRLIFAFFDVRVVARQHEVHERGFGALCTQLCIDFFILDILCNLVI